MTQVLETLKALVRGGPAGSAAKLFAFLLKRAGEDRVTRAAAALSYSTALATVPALALVLAMLAAFPAFEGVRSKVQDFIFANVLPDTGMRIQEQLAGFIAAAGELTAFGIIGLAFTAILLLLNIEAAFNRIFRVLRQRPLRMRLLVFWTVVTVGPILLGVSFSLSGYFSPSSLLPEAMAGERTSVFLGRVTPMILGWLAITFIYVVVPNRRVRLGDAMTGAAVAAVLLSALRYGFGVFVSGMTSYQAIYGAVAAVPVFLVWVYLNWTAVLVGAVIAAALPDWRHAPDGAGRGATLALALELIARLAKARDEGQGHAADRLAVALRVPDTAVTAALEHLREGRFVAATDDGRWILARDPERTPLADLVHHFGVGIGGVAQDLKSSRFGQRLAQHLQRAAESELTMLSISLARVVAAPEENADK